jgi:hypothetical protein
VLQTKTNSVALSPRANYTDWSTAWFVLHAKNVVQWHSCFHYTEALNFQRIYSMVHYWVSSTKNN